MQKIVSDESITDADIRVQNEALGSLKTFFASVQSRNPDLATVYVGTKDGLLVSYDPNSEGDGSPIYYEFRESDWYANADGLRQPAFTDTYLDGAGRGLTITCYAPVYAADGSFAGAIGMDFLQQDLNEQLVNVGITYPEKAVLVSATGTVIASTGEENTDGNAVTIDDRESGLPLIAVSDKILSEKSGLLITEDQNDRYYVAFTGVEAAGWKLCIISPVEDIIAPAVAIRNSIDGNTEQISNTVSDGIRTIIACCLVFFAFIVLLITYLVGKLSAKITDPLKHLEKDVMEISQGKFDQRTTVKTTDEIGSLARAFNSMTANLQRYISQLTEATAREERISAELNLAAAIQLDALPGESALPERTEFELSFTMTPAKEVGGDFYDFFLIDDSHLALLVADVSGKGVPASLFMMMSKMIIKNRALLGGTPGEILSFANQQLYENNKAEMFVTTWLGIVDLQTGVLTASNAGHEFPVIRQGNGPFALFKDRHGFVLAGIETSRYRDYTIQLQPGDVLYLYTDGVPEATDGNNVLFGNERMLDALNSEDTRDCKKIVENMLGAVAEFVGEAPQFDDMTMLCFRLDHLME